jgi:hypothetical protein
MSPIAEKQSVGTQIFNGGFGDVAGEGVRVPAQKATGHDQLHCPDIGEQHCDVQRIGDDVEGFQIQRADLPRNLSCRRARIQNDRFPVLYQCRGRVRDADFFRMVQRLLDQDRQVVIFPAGEGATARAHQRADALQCIEIQADRDRGGVEAP